MRSGWPKRTVEDSAAAPEVFNRSFDKLRMTRGELRGYFTMPPAGDVMLLEILN